MDNLPTQEKPADSVPSGPHKFRVKFFGGPANGIEKEYDREMQRVKYGAWLYEHSHKRVGDHWLFVKVPNPRAARRILPLITAARGGQDPRLEPKSEPTVVIHRGRNEPCWCGSGKKFKKCHAGPLSN
jgi:hypothetical protein